MSNLVNNYGRDWFRNKFTGAMFRHKGVAARVEDVDRAGVISTFVLKHQGKLKSMKVVLPYDEFTSSDRFNAPDLGYRTMHNGSMLLFIRRDNTSYVRAVALRNVRAEESQLTTQVLDNDLVSSATTDDDLHYAIMNPNYIPLRSGIKMLQQNKMLSFAASPVVAVEHSPAMDGTLNVLVAGKQVGIVDKEGQMSIHLNSASTLIEDLK